MVWAFVVTNCDIKVERSNGQTQDKQELSKRLDELKAKYDKQFVSVFEEIRQLMSPPEQPPREMGFHTLHQ